MMDGLALLHGILNHYSPTGEEGRAAAFLVEAMRELGFSSRLDGAGNVVGVLGEGLREIMLLGHIDTVPGLIPVKREGDLLYGRGAVDAKGPLACFAAAAARAGARPGWRLSVVGAVGEEGDSHGARYLARAASPPEMVFIGEPSGWERLALGYKGSAWLAYSVRQSLSHSAGRGESACEKALRFWNDLSALADDYNGPYERKFEQVTPTLREIWSSQGSFSETARLSIGVRLPLGVPPESLLDKISPLVNGGKLSVSGRTPAYLGEKNTPQVRAMLAAIRGHGGKPGFSLKTGTSDMNVVGPAWNCPILAYGPGDSSLDHTPEEHIRISEYLKSIAVLSAALQQLMEAGQP